MAKKDNTYLLALLGYPLGHTLSPLMHKTALSENKLEGLYVPFEIKAEDFKKVAETLKSLPFNGYNVTVPYKEKIIPFLDEIKEEAKIIGAVNTIEVGTNLIGHNTDSYGFLRSLKEDLKFNPKKKKVLLIGAGGAARACLYALAKSGVDKIYIADCDKRKSLNLKKHFSSFFQATEFINVKADVATYKKIIPEVNLLVNATPIGLKKSDPLIIPGNVFRNDLYVYDLVYNPPRTKLLQAAIKGGAKVTNGCGMLVYQGARAFEIWTKRKFPSKKIMKQFS